MKQQKIQPLHQPIEEALLAANELLRNEIIALLLDIAELREVHEQPAARRSFQMSREPNVARVAMRRIHR